MQDAAKLLPGSSDVLCRCAKSWSDACYLDFVTPERLTDADRRALNQRAVDYAKQVLSTVLPLIRPNKDLLSAFSSCLRFHWSPFVLLHLLTFQCWSAIIGLLQIP